MADESDGGGAGMLPQQALLAAIVDSSFDAIISKTLDGVITSWNGAAQRIFGYEASEAVGRSISILLPPERLEEEAFILQRLRRGERIANFETVRVRKDGRLIDVSVTSSPVRDRTAATPTLDNRRDRVCEASPTTAPASPSIRFAAASSFRSEPSTSATQRRATARIRQRVHPSRWRWPSSTVDSPPAGSGRRPPAGRAVPPEATQPPAHARRA